MYPRFGNNTYSNCRGKTPPPLAKCDVSGMIVNHTDLIPIMEYAGDTLYNTGLLAHKDFWYPPSPNLRTPFLFKDPRPVKNARPYSEPGFP